MADHGYLVSLSRIHNGGLVVVVAYMGSFVYWVMTYLVVEEIGWALILGFIWFMEGLVEMGLALSQLLLYSYLQGFRYRVRTKEWESKALCRGRRWGRQVIFGMYNRDVIDGWLCNKAFIWVWIWNSLIFVIISFEEMVKMSIYLDGYKPRCLPIMHPSQWNM